MLLDVPVLRWCWVLNDYEWRVIPSIPAKLLGLILLERFKALDRMKEETGGFHLHDWEDFPALSMNCGSLKVSEGCC